jgi:hypothetical protein
VDLIKAGSAEALFNVKQKKRLPWLFLTYLLPIVHNGMNRVTVCKV